jgi:hypothetical protein
MQYPNTGTFFNSTWIADGNSALQAPFIGTALTVPTVPTIVAFATWLRLDEGSNVFRTAAAQYSADGSAGSWKLGAWRGSLLPHCVSLIFGRFLAFRHQKQGRLCQGSSLVAHCGSFIRGLIAALCICTRAQLSVTLTSPYTLTVGVWCARMLPCVRIAG